MAYTAYGHGSMGVGRGKPGYRPNLLPKNAPLTWYIIQTSTGEWASTTGPHGPPYHEILNPSLV